MCVEARGCCREAGNFRGAMSDQEPGDRQITAKKPCTLFVGDGAVCSCGGANFPIFIRAEKKRPKRCEVKIALQNKLRRQQQWQTKKSESDLRAMTTPW